MSLGEGNPNLRVSLDGDQVVLHRGHEVAESVWNDARTWWGEVSNASTADLIAIPLLAFNNRKSWLRSHWKSLGRSLAIEDGIRGALEKLDLEVKEFENRLFASRPSDVQVAEFLMSHPYKRTPTVDQVRNVLSMVETKNGSNFSVPGAGKTSTQYMVWDRLRNGGLVEKMLVVCPKSSFEAWELEPKEIFQNHVNVTVFGRDHVIGSSKVLVINYEQVERPRALRELKKWLQEAPTLLAIDEAHRVKGGSQSVRWRALSQLSQLAARTDLLTGTPMPQGLDDIRNLLALSWRNLPTNYLTDNRIRQIKPWSVFVRTTKKQLGLPPVRIEKVQIPMGAIQQQIYSALGRSYMGTLSLSRNDRATLAKKGRAIFTLLGVATNPGLMVKHVNADSYLDLHWPPKELLGSAGLTDAINRYAQHELPPKYEWLAKFVEASALQNRKVLVWSTFVGNLVAIERVLRKFNPVIVHGGVQGDERAKAISKFRKDKNCHVLISNPQTLGEGISLHQECHDAVFVDRSFNAGQYLQALDRIHRLGLPSHQDTRIFLLESQGSIDTQVDARLAVKIQALSDLLDDATLVESALPSDDDSQSPLELLGLDEVDIDAVLKHLGGLHV